MPKKSILRKICLFFGFCLVLALGVYIFRVPILVGLAKAWIVDDPVVKADVVVVLGGGVQTRPFKAAELYRNGFASKVLVMNVEPPPTAELKLTIPEVELIKAVLVKEGVALTNIVLGGRHVTSTFDEANAVKEWAESNKVERLMIPTSLFHTRRVRWIFERTLKDSDVALTVVAIPERRYTHDNWWKHEEGLVAFQSELIKMAYYWIMY